MYSMPHYAPSANVADLRESMTIAVSTRAKALRAAGRAVIDLGAGEPDFPTPACVMEAAHRALDAGCTRYTQVEGIAPLREVIADRATRVRAVDARIKSSGVTLSWRSRDPRTATGVARANESIW